MGVLNKPPTLLFVVAFALVSGITFVQGRSFSSFVFIVWGNWGETPYDIKHIM